MNVEGALNSSLTFFFSPSGLLTIEPRLNFLIHDPLAGETAGFFLPFCLIQTVQKSGRRWVSERLTGGAEDRSHSQPFAAIWRSLKNFTPGTFCAP